MPVEVQYAVSQDRLPLSRKELSRAISAWAGSVMSAAGTQINGTQINGAQSEVCIRIVEKDESRQLNALYRNNDKPTNVLSFPADMPPVEGLQRILGDIVICADVVAQEAQDQGKSVLAHLAHMVIHGMLHLYGYDHERDSQSMHEMETLEREILGRFGVSDPYQEI